MVYRSDQRLGLREASPYRHRFAAKRPHGGVFPPFLLPFSFLLFLFAGIGENPLLAVGALVTLLLGSALLWRPGEAPILLFVFVMQWLQASTAIFYSNLKGVPVDVFLGEDSQSAVLASALTLLGTLVLAVGINASSIHSRRSLSASRDLVLRRSDWQWFRVYAVALIVGVGAEYIIRLVPGLAQLLLPVTSFRWAAFLILTMSAFSATGRKKTIWLLVFACEFLMGLGGLFSSFKEVFFYSLLGLVASGARLSKKQALLASFLIPALILLALAWTAIKTDYRHFVTGGERTQVVVVTRDQQIGKIIELAQQLDDGSLSRAADDLAKRLSYVSYFGAAVDYVPRFYPHEDGYLWWDALTRPFMPRILFPDKPILDDSEQTKKYTGIWVAGAESGTSISIGYVGESYIDFGFIGMFVPIFTYGVFIGWLHKWFMTNPAVGPLIGTGISASVLINISRIEISAAKAVGGLVAALIIWWLIGLLVPAYLLRRLRDDKSNVTNSRQ